jgi:hypothetical protein
MVCGIEDKGRQAVCTAKTICNRHAVLRTTIYVFMDERAGRRMVLRPYQEIAADFLYEARPADDKHPSGEAIDAYVEEVK